MTIVLPHGVLFRGGEEGEIRKNLIENNHIDAIIGLPANIFFGTGIPTIVMVLRQKRENTDVLIIDASKGFIKEGKNNKLRACDIKRISDVVIARETVEKFSRVVTRDEIRNNEYNLNIPRYVDSSEKAESWDIYASMFGGIPQSEIDELKDYWLAFPELREALFKVADIPYATLNTDNIKDTVNNHKSVIDFKNKYKLAFTDFSDYLKAELVEKAEELAISRTEETIANNIFARLADIMLIDKYEAYQILDDEWVKIAVDLEIIQTEGFEATKKVDPNMIIKKKDGKEQEVQDGWIGHVIPFELVQKTLLTDKYNELKGLETRLSQIPSEYEEIIDSLTEEEKESDILNDNNDAFVIKVVQKKLKELAKEDKTSEVTTLIDNLTKVCEISNEEKALKKKIKADALVLHEITKETIENLTDEQVKALLEIKWIESLSESINKLPDSIIDMLISKINSLNSKYATTYFEIEKEISETEKVLCSMIDNLCGNEFDLAGLNEFKSLLGGK